MHDGGPGRGDSVAVIGCGGVGDAAVVGSRLRELTGGFGADVVIDAVGRPETYWQAFYARDLAGTVVLVGAPTPM